MQYNPEKAKAKPEKRIEKVASGKVRKKSELRKLADVFISEDVQDVRSYIFSDILIPTIKKALYDIVSNGLHMSLFGEKDRDNKRGNASRVSYRDASMKSKTQRRYEAVRDKYSYDEVIFDTRGEAEEVLERMDELLETYEVVSIADYYDLVGFDSEHTDNKYGWTNLRSACSVRVRDGYTIKLPRPMPID